MNIRLVTVLMQHGPWQIYCTTRQCLSRHGSITSESIASFCRILESVTYDARCCYMSPEVRSYTTTGCRFVPNQIEGKDCLKPKVAGIAKRPVQAMKSGCPHHGKRKVTC